MKRGVASKNSAPPGLSDTSPGGFSLAVPWEFGGSSKGVPGGVYGTGFDKIVQPVKLEW